MSDENETLDDLVPGELVASIAGALDEFESISLPYEAVVYEDGTLDRDEIASAEAARVKSESLYGEAYVEREVEGDEDDPDRIRVLVHDPSEVVRDDSGEVVLP